MTIAASSGCDSSSSSRARSAIPTSSSEPQGRPVSGGGLHFTPRDRSRVSARRDADRLRVRDPHRHRATLRGARVNGKMVPLRTAAQRRHRRDPHERRLKPSRDWLSFVDTTRRATRSASRAGRRAGAGSVELGRRLWRRKRGGDLNGGRVRERRDQGAERRVWPAKRPSRLSVRVSSRRGRCCGKLVPLE